MAFTFGQSTPAFGGSTPAFGAASTPAFGQTGTQFGASSSAFSFASSTPAFGANSTPGFGAASTPAFGAASQPFGTPTIGANSAATPFGANSTPTFGASSPSLFGASSASLFGASSTPAFGTSSPAPLFGAATTGAFGASTGGGLFGASTSTPFNFASSAGTMFGANSSGATSTFGLTTQMAPASYSTGPTTDPAVKELSEIAAAYNPTSGSFRFTTLFLNVVENPAQRVKPAGVDELRWRQAMKEAGGENNPNKLWPVVARGFKDLAARAAEQERALQENKARIEQLRGVGHQLARRQEDALRERAVGLQRKQEELTQRLLRVWRHVDAAEARLGTVLGYRRDPAKEQQLMERLRALEVEVAPHSMGGLQRRLEALTAAARLSGGVAAGGAGGEELSKESQAKLFAVLKDHSEAIQRLQAVLQQDVGDLEVLRGELGGDEVMGMVMVPVGAR